MVEEIFKRIWELSPRINEPECYSKLLNLTNELISLYDLGGRLENDPFESSRNRELSLPLDKINKELKGSTCVVTGGLGCVGSALVQEILKFDVDKIIIIDKDVIQGLIPEELDFPNLILLACDILDFSLLNEIFDKYKPDFIFHTAAERDPGFAELNIAHTIKNNVFGTLNIVKACEMTGSVKQCVFSSTGKASRYITEEVYAATKKICENILDSHAAKRSVRYSMARFTHIVDNSLMDIQLRNAAENDDFIVVHSPGKFVTAQNVKEAAHLMLNALIYSEDGRCNFLLVRNLEWPVESLELALYYIKTTGNKIPIIFSGNPIGYGEKFFRGQLDWNNPRELNLLINVYENQIRRLNEDKDILISNICHCNPDIVSKVLLDLEEVSGESETKKYLLNGLREIFIDSLSYVEAKDTLNILNWGIQEKFLELEKIDIHTYGELIPLLVQSLKGSSHYERVKGICKKIIDT